MDKKTKSEKIGNRYAYYIEWLLKNDGWQVQNRSRMKYYDRGIDLIATKNGTTRYIQCKGWSLRAHIHENVVNQLFGSVAAVAGIGSLGVVEMFIYSPASPTPYAADKAKQLRVQIVQQKFPVWKRRKQYI